MMHLQDTEPGMRPSLASSYAGLEDSLSLLVQTLEELRPDAVLGPDPLMPHSGREIFQIFSRFLRYQC